VEEEKTGLNGLSGFNEPDIPVETKDSNLKSQIDSNKRNRQISLIVIIPLFVLIFLLGILYWYIASHINNQSNIVNNGDSADENSEDETAINEIKLYDNEIDINSIRDSLREIDDAIYDIDENFLLIDESLLENDEIPQL
jgi:hypothetical protein